jgi:Terminase small subunit
MPRLPDPRKERFAQAIASVMFASNAEAYRYASGNATLTLKHARVTASRWLSQANISARIKELRDKAEEECNMTRRELMDFYVEVIETPAGSIDKHSGLCQACEDITVETGKATIHRKKLCMPSKIDAADSLRRMMAWDKPKDKGPDPEGDTLTELLVMIRRRTGVQAGEATAPSGSPSIPAAAPPSLSR